MRDNIQAVLDRAGHGKHVIGLPAAPVILLLKMLESTASLASLRVDL